MVSWSARVCLYEHLCSSHEAEVTKQPHKFTTSENFPLATAELYCQGQQYVWIIPTLVECYLVSHLQHALQIETDSEIQRTADCQWADIVLRWRGRNLIGEVLKYPKLVHQREFDVKPRALLDGKAIKNTAKLQVFLISNMAYQCLVVYNVVGYWKKLACTSEECEVRFHILFTIM